MPHNQCDQIWWNFKSLWKFLEDLFSTWQNFEHTLATIGPILIIVNGQILTNNVAIWSHCSQWYHINGLSLNPATSKERRSSLSEYKWMEYFKKMQERIGRKRTQNIPLGISEGIWSKDKFNLDWIRFWTKEDRLATNWRENWPR